MKNLITYLKALWSRVADSQRNDRRHDCRRSDLRRSPSGFNSKLMLKLVSVLALVMTLSVGNAWGVEYTYTEFATSFKKGSTSGTSISTSFSTSTNVSTITASGSGNWATKVTACSNSYYSASGIGIRISKSSGAGYFTLTLSDALKDSTIYAIVIHASKVSGNTKSTLVVTPTAPSGGYTTVTNIANGTLKAYSASYDPLNDYYKLDTIKVGGKKISTLKFGSASGGYTHLQRVSIITQTEKAAAPACSSEITITKGSNPANGTFTISNSGTVCIDGGNASTTVTATPNSHYHLATVTSTGGGTVGAIFNNTCTVSNISANTTINVTFAADPTYTVTWVAGSNPSFSTQTNYAGTALTDPGTPSAASYCPGGKEFVGWTETPIVGEGSAPADLFTSVTGKSIPSGGTTYYAVFADASSGSVSKTYELTIERADVPSSYTGTWSAKDAAETGGGSGTLSVSLSGTNVMRSTASGHTTHIQFKASSTGFYNTTDLGTINSITTNNSDIKYYINSSSNPSSSGSGGYFRVYNSTSGARYTASIVINFTKTVSGTTYSNYATTCCTPLASINGAIKSISGTSATLKWDNLSGVHGTTPYTVTVSPSAGTSVGGISTVDGYKNCTVIGLTAGTAYTFTINAFGDASHCDASQEVAATTPKITLGSASGTSVYIEGDGPGSKQTFTVTAVGLTGNLTVTAPTNFAVCATADGSYTSSITLTPTSGAVSATVYFQLVAGKTAASSPFAGNVTVSGGSATEQTVAVNGVVSPACADPTINTQPAASASYNMNVTATALTVVATKNGTGPALTYQWYSNTANSKTTPTPTSIDGATTASYTPPTTATGTKYYFCEVSSGACAVTTNISAITVNTPSITVSETSRAFGDRAVNPENPYYTMTFTVSGSNLAKDAPIALALSGANAGMFSINKTSISQTSAGAVSSTTVTVTYNPTAVGSHSATITISSSGATDKTVSLSGTAKYTVTWMSNGEVYHSDLVASGKPTFPTNPSSCDATSTTFYGWATAEWDDKIQSLAGKTVYTEASAMPNVSGNVTYYAVFAKSAGGGVTTVLNEEFDNEQTSDATAAITSSTFANFSGATDKAYKSGTGGIKFGTSSVIGYITSKSLDLSSPFSVTLDCAKYGSDGANISVTIDGTTTQTIANSNFGTGKTLDFAAATASSTIKISTVGVSSKYRAYIDNVIVTKGSPATYSDYLTNCCTEWSAPTLSYTIPSGWKNGDSDIDASLGSGATHGSATWTSSDESVLTVNGSGRIHAVGAGTATVTVTWAGDGTYCEQSQTSATITVSGNVTVVFDKNGGTGTMANQSIPYNTSTALNANAYTAPTCKEFYGWADSQAKADAGTRDYTDGQSVTLTTGKTLYAVWKTITYTVTKGTCTTGTFSLSPASSIDCNGTITVTGTPDASHKGDPIVSISPADAGTVSGMSITNVSKNITVNVEFAAKDVYTITWSSPAGTSTSNITEGNTIGVELPSDPSSCSATYSTFIGWFPRQAGSESEPTAPATWTGYSDNDKVTASTVPDESVTYYAVFADGSAGGAWQLVTSVSELVAGGTYTLGSGTSGPASGLALGGQNDNNRSAVAWDNVNLKTFDIETYTDPGTGTTTYWFATADGYLYAASSSKNYLRSKAYSAGDGDMQWTISMAATGASTITAQGTNTHKELHYNSGSAIFSCYEVGSSTGSLPYFYKQGSSATGYISTCGTNISIENGGQYMTSANGIWVQSQQNITITGSRMTDTYGSVNVYVEPSSNTGKWRVKLASTTGQGGTSYPLKINSGAITTADWSGEIAVTYTPDAANVASEDVTFTVTVKKSTSPYTEVISKTFTMHGRSLPDNFVIAVTDGSGNWYAVPADMTGPYSGSGCSALGTYKPFPITVDNTTTPTVASDVPSRAVYTAAARTGAVNNYPQTLSFKSVPLTGGNYYLYGSTTSGDGSATNIQNASNATSEKQKWYLLTENNALYHMHTTQNENLLSYYSGKVGQYSAAGKKESIYLLPISGSTCTYFRAPDVTGVSLDATNYTIQFPVDRGATEWQISTNGGSTWTDLSGTTLVGECSPKTTVQAVLPLATYRGQTIDLKVKAASVCSEQKTTFTVPNPVITVNGSKPWHLYGITDAAFDDQSQTITLSGIYGGAGAETTVSSSNAEITASLVAPVTNGDVHVRLQMSAANATEGNHTTTLTFNSTGAETQTVEVIITMQSLAPQSFTKLGGYFSGDILCKNNDLSSASTYAFKLTNACYKSAGVVCELVDFNHSDMYLYDVATGERLAQAFGRTIDGSGVVQFSFTYLIGNMVEGKNYRIEWINTDLAVKNSSGVPYQDVSYTFTYGDCSKPIATPACPISKTGFTANWIPSGSNSQSLYVYTMGTGTKVCDHTWTGVINAVGKLNHSSHYNISTDPRGFYVAQQYTATATYSATYDGTKGQRMSGASNNGKVNGVYTIQLSETGNYRVTYTAVTLNSPNTLQVALTDNYGEVSSVKFTDDITTTAQTFEHIINVTSAGVKIALLPHDGVSGSLGSVFISYFKVEKVGAKSYVTGFGPKSDIASSITSYDITGLTADTRYYYTVSNGSESNEVSVTTRSDDPVIDFSPAKAVLQTDVNGSTSTPISLDGTNLTLCDLIGAISGTNASYFGYDLSGAVYNQITGALSGTLVITYHPTTTGNHTATFTIDGVSLDLEGHACPANYGTMATAATAVTKNSATANWSQSTTGYLMLAENSRVDDELLLNGGFEDDGLDWDGVPNTMLPSSGSRSNELNAAMKKTGSKGLYVRAGGNGSYLYPYNVTSGTGVMGGAVYSAKRTLPAGTYTISCYVHGASNASSLSAFPNSDQNFYVGFAVDCPSNMYASARRSINPVTGTNVKNQSGWVQVTGTFTLEEPTSGYIFLCNSTSGSNHAADDFSLKYTAAGHGNNFTEYPITSATSLALTDLKPHTSYSYYVMNSDGCESNIIDFTTTDSDDPITITADPNPVNLIAAIGSTAKQTVVISEENAYSSILLSVGDCGGRISVSPTSLGAAGGVAVVSFTPLPGDEMGDNGTCTISATTLGLGSPASITVNWSVAAGYDMNTPTIEVTDITNSSITVEHNIEIGEDSEMRIQLDRELSEDEIEENVGDEIFFSKYYEAYSHKKILAIYNPTNEKISLKGTYIWRSKNDYSDWNRETGISLVNYGKETGFIGPQEEIIFYNSQLSYTCEQTKTDMSEWAGTTDQAISYDGDDAFLLVRKVRTGEADYRTPPAESVEEDGMGNPIPLTWRTIVDDDETEWTMLDLIGARAKNNMPDGSGVQGRWSWRNCKTSTTESGDEKGWVGYGYDVNDDPWSSNTCNSQPAGYLLSTNRCLLLRRYTVKSGNNAVSVNVGDMNTLGKNAIQSEWKGAHVPTEGDQEAVSCENFSFVGGYDYANYYNAWTPLGESDYVVGDRNSDGSYTVTDINVPKYWCNKLRVEIIEKQTVNGVEVENVRLYEDYKVPIVINTNTTTNTASFFGNPNNPTYSGAEDNAKKDAWRTACADCDIVIRDNAKLEHVTSGVSGFNNMTIYPGAKFDNSSKLGFTLNGLQIQALNDNVGYAIINDNGSTITADNIVHVKRIDDQYWYPFSLPYDCEITAIRQQNGKSMGEYWEDWGIKYYDGADRQAQGESAAAGANSKFWKQMPADGTLHANQAYIIGLFTTEWDGQIKNVYFPPKEASEYTEAGDDAKTTTISKWAAGYDSSDESKTRHYGWNFTASPYISMFGEDVSGQGFNNTSNLIMGEIQNDGSYANTDYVYVSVPDGADSKTYTQVRATATTLEPFKGYFVQAKTNGSDGSLTLTYAKDYRTLSQAPARKATAQKQRVDVDLKAEGNGHSDIAGIVVDDEFTTAYEIGGDLTKMYAAATKPQLYFLGQNNEKMAYIAIPDANAEDIPMELYAPKAGQYIISLNKRSSRTDGAESVELLYNGNVLTNLLIDSCTINANNKGVISGYSVRIRRIAQVITSMDLINGEHVTVITNNGQMSITNLPGDAKVFVYDMTGRLMSTGNADGESVVNIDSPQQGVYNVVVQSAAGKTTIRTIVR